MIPGVELSETNLSGRILAGLKVSDAIINKQLSNSSQSLVMLDLSAADLGKYDTVTLAVSKTAAKDLLQSEKALLIKTKTFSLNIPNEALQDFSTTDGFAIPFSSRPPGQAEPFPAASDGAYSLTSSVFALTRTTTHPFTVPLTLTLPLNGPADIQKSGIYAVDEQGKWGYFSAGTFADDHQLSVKITSPGTYAAASYAKTFVDLTGHWAKTQIEILAAHHLIAGKGTAETFKPNDFVTQAEFKTLFDRLLGTSFDWQTRAQEDGAGHLLTREEAAVLIAQALGTDLSQKADSNSLPAGSAFVDRDSISPDTLAAVQFAAEKGYLQGTGGNAFNPKSQLTRAQAAVLLDRVLQDQRTPE